MDQWADELFIDELDRPKWESYVTDRLRDLGVLMKPLPERVRDDRANVSRFHQGFDLWADGKLLDVSCRRLEFSGPDGFEHDPIRVGPLSGFRGRYIPFSVLVVSRLTGAIISVRCDTIPKWQLVDDYDFTLGRTDKFYYAPLALWHRVCGPAEELP